MKFNILKFATIALFMAGFASCSNDNFNECVVENATASKISQTRSSVPMTTEEVQARLQALNEKYNESYIINKTAPAEEYDDYFFVCLENVMRRNDGLELLPIEVETQSSSIQIIDDSSIDEINIATASSIPEYDPNIENTKLYAGSNSSYEIFYSKGYTRLDEQFLTYRYDIFYNFTYGRRSELNFENFVNVTDYSINNMPKNGINEYLSQDEVDKIAKDYQLKYVDDSLWLIDGVIRFDNNKPEDLTDVRFSYAYRFTLGNLTFQVTASNNSRAHSIGIINP